MPLAIKKMGLLEHLDSADGGGQGPAELSSTRVASGLRTMIVAGKFRSGSWLRMQAIADRFGVSVQPVREALQLLQGEGLVELHPNRGAQVRGLDGGRLIHIYEIRAAMESFMARRFALEASHTDLCALEQIQARHERAVERGDWNEVVGVNRLFHGVINQHGGNGEAQALIGRYYDLSSSLRARVEFRGPYFARVRNEHHALLDAFRRHDATAAAEIGVRHVLGTLDDILGALGRTSAAPRAKKKSPRSPGKRGRAPLRRSANAVRKRT